MKDTMMSTNKDFSTTPESTGFDRTKLIFKHQMSGALDALTSFKIDAAAKTVEVEQHTTGREPLLIAKSADRPKPTLNLRPD